MFQSDIQAVWEDNGVKILLADTTNSQPKNPAKYDYLMSYDGEEWTRKELLLAGKKSPEVRQMPATCFLTHSLLLHGGLSLYGAKQKPLGDFFIL